MATIVRNTPREKAIHTIISWIDDGRLEPGVPLPAEMDFADRLSISRGTARSALAQLEEQGVLRRDGRKRFVAADAAPAATSLPGTIALLGVAEENPQRFQGTGYIAAMAAGAMEAIAGAGKNALSWHPRNLNSAGRDALLRLRPDAVLVFEEALLEPDAATLVHELRAAELTVVICVDSPEFQDIDRIVPDFADGNRQLVHRLAERGCRRILPMSWDEKQWWQDAKDKGYMQGMRECGLAPLNWPRIPRHLGQVMHNTPRELEAVKRVYAGYLAEFMTADEPVDAIMVNTDWQVPMVAGACQLLGKEPGRDVLLAGFDNKFDFCPWREWNPQPPLFTVDKNNSLLGARMVKLAVDDREPATTPRRLLQPVTIVCNNQSE